MTESVWTVPLERHEFVTQSAFADVLERIHGGLGHPDLADLQRLLAMHTDWDTFAAAIQEDVGTSGLMVFLELDLGGVLTRKSPSESYRAVRVIAGNPVTMAAMTRTTPAAGAFAPITVLIFEAHDGVHCRYDTMVSATTGELTNDALVVAKRLDESVLTLLAAATAPI